MDSPPPAKKKKKRGPQEKFQYICVVHVEGQQQYGEIKLLSATNDPQDRLVRLHEIKERRLSQPADSPYRMEKTCSLIPDILQDHHGYHRPCYQRFTSHLDRLKEYSCGSEASTSRPTRSQGDQVLFKPDCIFCNSEKRKKVKVKGSWTTEGMSVFDRDGWQTILQTAEGKKDEKMLRRIRGHDLFACEAKYHQSCRVKYVQDPRKWQSLDETAKTKQQVTEQVHSLAFSKVCESIDREVLQDEQMVKLSEFTEMYNLCLQANGLEHANYRGTNLKIKLQNHYEERLSFCSLGNFRTDIVYNADISTEKAMRCCYELGSKDIFKEAGIQLHQVQML